MNYATSALPSRRAFPGEILTPCTYQMIPASKCGFASWRENASEAVQATVVIAASALGIPLKDLPLCSTEPPETLVTTPGSHGDNEITCCCKHAFIIRGVYRHLHVPVVYTEDFAFISSAHPQGMSEAQLRPGVFPLSSEELDGKFNWAPPWDTCPRGDPSSGDWPAAQTWLEVMMPDDLITSLGGRAPRRAGTFKVSCYVHGYGPDANGSGPVVGLSFPLLQISIQVPEDTFDVSRPDHWPCKLLLRHIRGLSYYQDGCDEAGYSVFTPVPAVPLVARVAELAQKMKPDESDQAFVPRSPSKPQVYASKTSAAEEEGGLARVVSQVWLKQRDGVRVASPFATRGNPELVEAPAGHQPEAAEVCHNCEAPIKGDGSYACQCGIVPVPRAPLPARLGAAFGQEPPGPNYSVLFAAVLNSGGNTGRDAQSTHGSLPHRSSSQPPSDDGSDSSSSSSSESSSQDSDDEHGPPDLPNLPPPPEADTAVGTVMERAYLAALAGATSVSQQRISRSWRCR